MIRSGPCWKAWTPTSPSRTVQNIPRLLPRATRLARRPGFDRIRGSTAWARAAAKRDSYTALVSVATAVKKYTYENETQVLQRK